jgi:HAD superfamily hydrolase (TIGR01509 family)
MNTLIIFDFDGVIVDTEKTTFNFYQNELERKGIIVPDSDFKYKIGRKSVDFFKDILKDKYNTELVEDLIQKKRDAFIGDIPRYVHPIVETHKLIKDCFDSGLTLVLGSQNEKQVIERTIDVFDLRKYFSLVLSIDDIQEKKPNPEIFLLAMQKMNKNSEQTVVIEDSPTGIQAAKRAGCTAIGLARAFDPAELFQADMVVHSAQELNPELLRSCRSTSKISN